MSVQIKDFINATPTTSDYIPLSQSGNTRKATLAQIRGVVNDVTTGGTDVPLSAEQGKQLSNKIGDLSTLTTSDKTSLVNAIKENTTQLSDRVKISDYEKTNYYADTGTANTYVITPNPAITAYSTGQTFKFKATNSNTGASTLNVNGLGAKALVKDVNVALVAGDILSGQVIEAIYDGTNFQIVPNYNAKFATKSNKNIVETIFTGSATLSDITLSKDSSNYNVLLLNFNKSGYGTEIVKVYAGGYPSKFNSSIYEYHNFKISDGDFRFRVQGTSFIFNNSGVAFASPLISIQGVFEE